MQENSMRKIKVGDMVQSALFIALIVIGTYTKIPIYIVPFTLQFLFTNLTGLLLGSKRASLTIGIYILIGLIGFPVFTGGGGISYVIHPTFGYIVGFMVGGYLAGKIVEQAKEKTILRLFLAGCVNLTIVYLMGLIHYYWIAKIFLTPVALPKIIWSGALIFLPVDLASCFIGAIIAQRIFKSKNQ